MYVIGCMLVVNKKKQRCLYNISIMSPIKSCIIILLLLSSTTLSAYISSQGGNLRSAEGNQQFSREGSSRLLQAISTSDKTAATGLSKAITEANTFRQSKGLPLLGINTSIGTIVSQWFKALKGSLALTMYLQLYGIVNVQIQTYPSIPSDYVTGVLQELSMGLYDRSFNQVGSFSGGVDRDNYEVILIFQGGDNAQAVEYSIKNIQDVIAKINAKNKPAVPAESNKSQDQSGVATSSTPSSQQVKQNAPVVSTPPQSQTNPLPSPPDTPATPAKSEITDSTNTSKTITTVSQSQTSNNVSVTQQSQSNQTSQTTQNNQNTQSSSSNSTNSTSSATVITQIIQNNAPPAPAPTPTPIPTPTTTPIQSTTASNSTTNANATQSSPVSNYQSPTDSTPKTQTPSTPTSSVPPTTVIIQNPPIVPNNTLPTATPPPSAVSPPVLSTITQTTAPAPRPTPSYTTPAAPGLPLITQTTFINTTSFAGITLFHGLPTTFLKNEIFPFKGRVTSPNPSGTTVSVIFTRVSDQQRLGFSQWVAANTSSFKILASLNMSGVYYLSVFAGSSGFTALQQYTIAPGFIGQIVSRPPTPLSNASINLINNDLWVNWTYSDVSQPALTLIIFSQGGYSVQFLLSNYETSFKVPYDKFWAFNVGPTDVQITQAFSSNQSGNSRTSDFSAPYNIIFNATNHNYAIVKNSSQFAPIPLRVPAGVVKVVGPAGVQLENTVILQTPSKSFIEYKIDSNSSSPYIQKGFPVNLTITLNEPGVYILEVNDVGGEALINIPLYNGDIYPLVPDFVDLTPPYIDLAALNQPSLIEDRRSLVLDMLNSIRSNYGVGNLYLDKNLNALAQNYSAVMIQNNFISHIDLQGNTPSQRAAAAGILEAIGENLAMNNNLTQAQLMLQRSPAHLQNMVNPDWTRVGLGIAQNGNKFYFLTQVFSSRDMTLNPLSSAEIAGIQSYLVSHLLGKYSYLQNEDKALSSRLNAYQQMKNRPYIITYLQGFGYRNVAVANVQVNYNSGKFMNLIKNGNNFEPTSPTFTQIGATAMYSNGNLQIFAAYV